MREDVLGGLRVRITGGTDREGGGTGPVVVLLHGFGAPGDDLAALWRVLRVPVGTRFVFPEAPLSLGPGFMGGRAWWMIDMARLEQSVREGRQRDLSNEVPDGLPAARERVFAMLDEIDEKLRPSHLILGGFSQGAMLSCDVALRTDRKLAGLVLLSSTLLASAEWKSLLPNRHGLPVFQSHGKDDSILPFSIAEQLHEMLAQAGLEVDWVPFGGGHAIPSKVLEALGAFLDKTLK